MKFLLAVCLMIGIISAEDVTGYKGIILGCSIDDVLKTKGINGFSMRKDSSLAGNDTVTLSKILNGVLESKKGDQKLYKKYASNVNSDYDLPKFIIGLKSDPFSKWLTGSPLLFASTIKIGVTSDKEEFRFYNGKLGLIVKNINESEIYSHADRYIDALTNKYGNPTIIQTENFNANTPSVTTYKYTFGSGKNQVQAIVLSEYGKKALPVIVYMNQAILNMEGVLSKRILTKWESSAVNRIKAIEKSAIDQKMSDL